MDPQLKQIRPRSVFNTLSREGHALLDLRPIEAYNQHFIRQAYHLPPAPSSSELAEFFLFVEKVKANIALPAQQLADLRTRLIVVVKEGDEKVAAEFVAKYQIEKLFNEIFLYVDSEDLTNFRAKYPFLVLGLETKFADLAPAERTRKLFELDPEAVMFANASFPFEVIEDLLFLGTNIHKNSQKILQELKIDTVLEIVLSQDATNLIEETATGLTFTVDPSKLVDFDGLFEKMAWNGTQRVLFTAFSSDVSKIFLLGFLMFFRKKSLNEASLTVFVNSNGTSVNKTLYNQLMNFTPGKIKIRMINSSNVDANTEQS